ncbi:MAG: hypothetical protein F4Y80_14200 [Caldilineaceae bacterium SB0665_bin_21]|nr:hypothetical protein [Caldilineaceae bacterium SB0665_bin_21]
MDVNDYAGGVLVEDEWAVDVGEALSEMQRRREVCGEGYPFAVDTNGNFARYDPRAMPEKAVLYKFLLLATRLDMSKLESRQHAGKDGTVLFEYVAAEVTRMYLGPRAEKMNFGANVDNTDFASRVEELCQRLGEGEGFRDEYTHGHHMKDDKLDIVLWKSFADRLAGQLIVFGQCKTGTSYQNTLGELHPEAFCGQWLLAQPAVAPLRFFLIADALSPLEFERSARRAGVLFDRCRIIDFCDALDQDVLDQVSDWTAAAAHFADLPIC